MSSPSELFHATPAENVPAILREGLLGTEEWGHDEPTPALVHVMEDPENTRGWVAHLYGLDESDVRVFRVDVDGLEILPGLDGPPAYAIRDRVSPDRLTLLT